MYCGSCMRDNTLAAALHELGCDVWLIPMYTPIRTDEQDVSRREVFYGGLNVYLQERFPIFRRVPRFMDRWLDRPWLINLLAGRSIEVDGEQLGELAVSVLRGDAGHQRKEVHRLVDWLSSHARPHLVNLSNLLIAGTAPVIRRELGVPVIVTLQGDDLFLNHLREPHHGRALAELRRLVEHIDGFIVFTEYYARSMIELLDIPRDKLHVARLGIKLDDFRPRDDERPEGEPRRIGYLARLCADKGLDVLVDAFIELKKRADMRDARLDIAGWLGAGDRRFAEAQWNKLRAAGLGDDFHYAGSVDRQAKLNFLRRLDVFSVPTRYQEPKGIYALEAMASGVPVAQPDHGAFPEMLARAPGGVLFRAADASHLAERWAELLTHRDEARRLGRAGREAVLREFRAETMARETLAIYERLLAARQASVQ